MIVYRSQGQDKEIMRRDKDLLISVLREAGSNYKSDSIVSCPFHTDKHPSGSIFTKDGVWRFACHSGNCTWDSGDILDVMAKLLPANPPPIRRGSACVRLLGSPPANAGAL